LLFGETIQQEGGEASMWCIAQAARRSGRPPNTNPARRIAIRNSTDKYFLPTKLVPLRSSGV